MRPLLCAQEATRDGLKTLLLSKEQVHLVSYPKSGATWLRFMLSEIIRRMEGVTGEYSVELEKFASADSRMAPVRWTHDDSEVLREDGTRPDARRLFAYGGRHRFRGRRVVLLIRDPRDVVVSYYHQVTRRSAEPMVYQQLDDFVRDPLLGIERIARFYNIWRKNLCVPEELLVVRYEQLMERGPAELETVVRFLGGKDIPRQTIEDVFEFGRADNLRELERKNLVAGMRSFGTDANALKVRRAIVGGHRLEMSESLIRYCDGVVRQLSKPFDYPTDPLAS